MLSAVLCIMVMAIVIAVECLISIWVATSSRPILGRALVGWAAVVPLVPIHAYWPALFFTMTTAVTIGLVSIIRWWLLPRMPLGKIERVHFRLSDLFVLVLFVATVIALGRDCRLPVFAYLFLPLFGVVLAPVLTFAHFAVTGPARGPMIVAAVIAILISTAGVLLFDLFPLFARPALWGLPVSSDTNFQLALQALVLACLILCISLVVWLARQIRRSSLVGARRAGYIGALAIGLAFVLLICFRYVDLLWFQANPHIGKELSFVTLHTTLPASLAALLATAAWLRGWIPGRPSAQRIALAAGAFLALPFAWLYWQMVQPHPFPPPPDGPNQYDRIAAISRELADANRFIADGRVPPHLYPLVDEAVKLLAAPNYIPTSALEAEIDHAPQSLNGHDLSAIHGFFVAAAEAAQEKGNFDRGAEYALATIRFGSMFHRGGTMAQASNVGSMSNRSLEWLLDGAPGVSSVKAREIIQVLDRTLAESDSREVLEARDRIYWERSGGWQLRLLNALGDRRANGPLDPQLDLYLGFELFVRAIQVKLAIRLFLEMENRLPATLAELVPSYLPQLPLDPYSGRPLVYRYSNGNFVLYSVGRDKTDDGGSFDAHKYYVEQGYDIDLTRAYDR